MKCSEEIKEKNLISPEGEFIIKEEYYLTEELKYNLKLGNSFNTQNYNVDVSKTIDRIKSQINHAWGEFQINWYDGLYEYILNKVKLISLEYNNVGESLKYFLNINSLSIQLTQSDIFFSILSQSLRISGNIKNIFTIKKQVLKLSEYFGISKKIENYKAYENDEKEGICNIIYVFLNAFYQKDSNILFLGETGVGKWISFYKNEVFIDQIKAKEFSEKFIRYLDDFEKIYKNFTNMNVNLETNSSLYLSSILIKYESYHDILKSILEIFRKRHNYMNGENDLYDENFSISLTKLNEIAKRLNLTLLWNYIRSSNKRLDGFIDNISLSSLDNYKKSIADIIYDIDVSSVFNLNYNDKKQVSNTKIKDESRIIKVIFGIQQAFLSKIANTSRDFSEYLDNILTSEFSIEHLYSIKEYESKERLENWQNKKGKFINESEFDISRFKFENLSLLGRKTNSSAGDNEIFEKLSIYRNARKIFNSESEYLIQSSVEGSEYYKNDNIRTLNLPERKIKNIDQNTWDLSPNNRDFNIKLLNFALDEISTK